MNRELLNLFPLVGSDLVYLDSAATTLRCKRILEHESLFALNTAANIHRGAHRLSQESTAAFESARQVVHSFMGGDDSGELIFTSGTTDGINLIAHGITKSFLKKGDVILVSESEHHSNLLPWQRAADESGATLKFIEADKMGVLQIDQAVNSDWFSKVRVLAIQTISNVTGIVHDIRPILKKCREIGAISVVDGAQSIGFQTVNVRDLNCDFFVFSGHKMYASFGVGAIYARKDLLNDMAPYRVGGGMVDVVDFLNSTYLMAPQKFEAGTPNVVGVIGLAEAARMLTEMDLQKIEGHERKLTKIAKNELASIRDILVYGNENQSNTISFNLKGIHHFDVATILNEKNVAVRSGHHCAQVLMKKLGVSGTVRASFGIYNTEADVEKLVEAVMTAQRMLS
jgi:cysteine desulfurase/selenocysteine lyase